MDGAADEYVNRRFLARLMAGAARCYLAIPLLLCPFALISAESTNSPGPVYPPNRYLLIIETSHAMLRRSEAMLQAVQDVLASGVAAQARRGDSLGIWTFNEELHTGLVPLQDWSPQEQNAITKRVTGFVRAQKLEKAGRLDKVVPQLNRLVKSSPFLTVIIVCTGDTEIRGTRFDDRVNNFFQTWRLQQQDARAPFIVALRAQAGALVDCSINPAPWHADLPALPKELLVPVPAARPQVAATPAPKPTTSSVPPLIIIGKKREAPPSDANTPAPATTASPLSAAPVNSATQAPADPAALSAPVSGSKPLDLSSAPQPIASPSQPPAPPVAAPLVGVTTNSPSLTVQRITDSGTSSANVTPPEAPARVYNTNNGGIEVANAGVSNAGRHWVILLVIGSLLLAAILATVWVWRVRSRSTGADSSLITESIDRHKPQR